MDKQYSLNKVIERVGDLPAMPALVAELLRVTDDPMVELSDVGVIVERDPALTAKILKISNSPYYGMKQYVGTMKLALVILGVREVRNIVLGIVVADKLHDERFVTLMAKDFWNHAFFVAGLARKLTDLLGETMQGEAFTSGLLHDIGKLLLIRQIGAPYAEIYKKSGGESLPLCRAEEAGLGFTHADAAAALATAWNFPEALTDALSLHHPTEKRPLNDAKDPKLAAIVRIADLATHDDFESEPLGVLTCLEDTEAWAILGKVKIPIPVEQRQEVFKTMYLEMKAIPIPQL